MKNQDFQRLKKYGLFAAKFEQHVGAFIKEYHLIPKGTKIYLAVSGGVDSMALAQVFYRLGLCFELIHFNHGTRAKACEQEEEKLRQKALLWGVKIHVFRGQFSLGQANFEALARRWRKSIYARFMDEGGLIFTAHHLDDSYEWSLMQSAKQGSLRATLGIPLKGPGMRRPFLCVTKRQVLRYAHATRLDWLEDQSNQDLKFERNNLRHQVTAELYRRYPSLLRNYVAQRNELARLLGVHAQTMIASASSVEVVLDPSQGVLLTAEHMQEHKALIKKWIQHFSNKHRGEIDRELDKLLLAHHKLQHDLTASFKGPMQFSGGVQVFLLRQSLFVMGQGQKEFFSKLDGQLKLKLQKLAQIPFGYVPCFPFLLIGKHAQLKKSSRSIHPLFPQTCAWLKHAGVPYVYAPLLTEEVRQKLLGDAVILASS